MSAAALPPGSLAAAPGGTGDDGDDDRFKRKLKAACEGCDSPPSYGMHWLKVKHKGGMRAADSTPLEPLPCPVCAKTFWSMSALYGHMRLHRDRSWRGLFRRPPSKKKTSLLLLPGTGRGKAPSRPRQPGDGRSKAPSRLRQPGDGRGKAPSRPRQPGAGGGKAPSRPRPQPQPQQVFQCSTCNRFFPSRQALGGHRATHRQVKGCYAIDQERGRLLGQGSSYQAQAEGRGDSAEENDKKHERLEQMLNNKERGKEKKIAEEDVQADEETEKLAQKTNEGNEADEGTKKLAQKTNEGDQVDEDAEKLSQKTNERERRNEETEKLNPKKDETDERAREKVYEEAEDLTEKKDEIEKRAEEKEDEEPESQTQKMDVDEKKPGPSSPVRKRPVFDLNLPPT